MSCFLTSLYKLTRLPILLTQPLELCLLSHSFREMFDRLKIYTSNGAFDTFAPSVKQYRMCVNNRRTKVSSVTSQRKMHHLFTLSTKNTFHCILNSFIINSQKGQAIATKIYREELYKLLKVNLARLQLLIIV